MSVSEPRETPDSQEMKLDEVRFPTLMALVRKYPVEGESENKYPRKRVRGFVNSAYYCSNVLSPHDITDCKAVVPHSSLLYLSKYRTRDGNDELQDNTRAVASYRRKIRGAVQVEDPRQDTELHGLM